MDNLKDDAEQHLKDAVASTAAAFDLGRSRAWTFAPEVEQRAEELLAELVALFHRSPIVRVKQPAHIRRLEAYKQDPAFIHFLYALTAQASNGAFVGRRAHGNRRRAGRQQ